MSDVEWRLTRDAASLVPGDEAKMLARILEEVRGCLREIALPDGTTAAELIRSMANEAGVAYYNFDAGEETTVTYLQLLGPLLPEEDS